MNAFLFFTTVMIWGTTWIAISFQVGATPVIVSVFYRFLLASVITTMVLLLLKKLSIPALRHHPFILIQSICLFSVNFICLYYATNYIPSGVVAVIFSLSTIFNAINSWLFFNERLSPKIMTSSLLGAIGLSLLLGKDIYTEMQNYGTNELTYIKGLSLATLGTLLFSFGNMASKRNSLHKIPVIVANSLGMIYASLILLSLIFLKKLDLKIPNDLNYILPLLYLSLFGSVIGFATYLSLVARVGASKASYSTVLFPVVALLISSFYEGYNFSIYSLLGLSFAILGNFIIFYEGKKHRRFTK